MTKVSYSTVFEQTADQVWAVIRDFNSYPVWVASVTESHIEDGKAGDTVGAIRNFVEFGVLTRQRLVAHSDLDRFYTYESCEPLGAITYYQGTGRVTPIVDSNRAFMEESINSNVGGGRGDLRKASQGSDAAMVHLTPSRARTISRFQEGMNGMMILSGKTAIITGASAGDMRPQNFSLTKAHRCGRSAPPSKLNALVAEIAEAGGHRRRIGR
jgi:hypothetical protein